jgi:hypothetical protein
MNRKYRKNCRLEIEGDDFSLKIDFDQNGFQVSIQVMKDILPHHYTLSCVHLRPISEFIIPLKLRHSSCWREIIFQAQGNVVPEAVMVIG